MALKDKIGQTIKVGDWIAYGHALGRCAGLRLGLVIAVKETPSLQKRRNDNNELVDTEVWEYRITVQGIDDDWEWRKPELTTRKGTLMFPNRTLVIPLDKVPPEYIQLTKGLLAQ